MPEEQVTLEVLAYRVAITEKAIEEIRDAVRSIEASLKVLAQLEQQHASTREKMVEIAATSGSLDARIRAIETKMPGLEMIKGWVIAGTIGVVGLTGAAVFKLILAGS